MLSQDELDKLKSLHGDLRHCVGKDGAWEVVLKRPQRKHYKVFRSMVNNPSQKSDASEFIVRQMVVHPPLEAFDALLEVHMGICESSSVQLSIIELCGMQSDEVGKP